jgi:metal-responsive CopG/Arc/MetJ family transcriptional regulator
MTRTTLSLPEELLQKIRVLAAERRISMAEFMRQAIEEKAIEARPKPRSIGAGASGRTDTAQRAGDERPVPRSWR